MYSYMNERAIHISSLNRIKVGRSKTEDFVIKFNPVLKLNPEMRHELAVDRLSMTYSWHNISPAYGNDSVKYSTDGGNSWETVKIVAGMYSYDDISDYIHQYMDTKNHKTAEGGYNINITFVLSSYKVVIEIENNYQLDLRETTFGELLGFTKKVITRTEYGSMLPNITNSIDSLYINSDAITDSIVNGNNSNTLCVIPTDNLTRSFPFTFEPRRALFSPLAADNISQMRFYVSDALNRPLDLNNIDWYITLILRSTPI